jgi:quercetin dioxygenase-like cupin family protein
MASFVLHPVKPALKVSEVVTIHYFEYDKNYEYHGESHDFWEIVYADRGTVISTCDGEEYLLSDGEMILLPPNCFHTIRADRAKPSNVFIISFTEELGTLETLGGRVLRLNAAMRALVRGIVREGEAAFACRWSARKCSSFVCVPTHRLVPSVWSGVTRDYKPFCPSKQTPPSKDRQQAKPCKRQSSASKRCFRPCQGHPRTASRRCVG